MPEVKEKADIRTINNHIRATKNIANEHVIEGKAIVFNQQSEYMGFYEIIKPEAVEGIDWSNTLLLYDHSFSNILARVDAKNLTINVKEDGVYFQATLNDSTLANDVYNDIKSGNVKGCSFGFNIAEGGDTWDFTADGTPLHIITKIENIPELSLTPIPAYTQTSASVVRHLNKLEEVRKMADKEKEIKKEEKTVEEPKAEKKDEPKAEKEVKAKVSVNTDDLMAAIQSAKELLEQVKAVKGSDDKPKEEKVEEPKEDEEPKEEKRACDKKEVKRADEEKEKEEVPEKENLGKDVIENEKNKEPKKDEKGSDKIGGKKDMTQILKEKDENKKSEEVRNFEAFLKGETRALTDGFKETPDGQAVIPNEILSMQKEPNDPSQLEGYVNKVQVTAPAGRLPILQKATAVLATAQELQENPNIANATINKVTYELSTYRGSLPISKEMISDYPDISSVLSDYVQEVRKQTAQKAIGAVLQTATAETVSDLDGIKALSNKLIPYGDDVKFVVTASMFNVIDTMKDAEGRYLLHDDITTASGKTLFGHELIVVPDTILGSDGDTKFFVGSLKGFVLEAYKDDMSVNWTENQYFEQVLGVYVRMNIVKADEKAGYFGTYTAPKAVSASAGK